MEYASVVSGVFVDRPNRFIAHVTVDGRPETVHVKNTGRCRELLIPGVPVILSPADNPARKTRYDLVAVCKKGLGYVNLDSQAPNRVVAEWLSSGRSLFGTPDLIRPEFPFGRSRVDFYLEKGERRILLEVKGCTLEENGVGYFPDAPTLRGARHFWELAAARKQGYECYVAFVIALPGIERAHPNRNTDPDFAKAWEEGLTAGVKILHLPCEVAPGRLCVCPDRVTVEETGVNAPGKEGEGNE